MASLPPRGSWTLDLDRVPGPEDWLVVAIGSERLVPVRGCRRDGEDRLGIVVYLVEPPSEEAITLLVRLLADVSHGSAAISGVDAASGEWARSAAARIRAAIGGPARTSRAARSECAAGQAARTVAR